jgi:hypothetical protein
MDIGVPPAQRKEIADGFLRLLADTYTLWDISRREPTRTIRSYRVAENLYDELMLRDAFSDFEIMHLVSYDADIHEGDGHPLRAHRSDRAQTCLAVRGFLVASRV